MRPLPAKKREFPTFPITEARLNPVLIPLSFLPASIGLLISNIIAQTIKGEAIVNDWTGTLATGSVVLTNIGGNAAAEGTVEAIVAARTKLANGTLNVFDTANFTVTVTENKNKNATVDENGKLTGYMADVNTDAAYTPDTQVVENGIFKESKFRSAPYFDIQIDGITLITEG